MILTLLSYLLTLFVQYCTECLLLVRWLSGWWLRPLAGFSSSTITTPPAICWSVSSSLSSPSFTAPSCRIRGRDAKRTRRPSQTSSSCSGQVVRVLVGLFAASSPSPSSWPATCWPGLVVMSPILPFLAQLLWVVQEVHAETLPVHSYVRPLGGIAAQEAEQQTGSLSGSVVATINVHGTGPGSLHLSDWTAKILSGGGNVDSSIVTSTTLEMAVFRWLPSHPCYGVDGRRNDNNGGECDVWSVPGFGIRGHTDGRRYYCSCNTTTTTAAAVVQDDPAALACPISNDPRGRPQLLFDNGTTSVTGRRFATVQGHQGAEIPIPLRWVAVVDDGTDHDPSMMNFVESGTYTVIVADCGSSSEALLVSGSVIVTNSHGSLPAHLWPVVRLYGAVFVVYVVLLVLYSLGLYRKSRTSRPTTPVECGIVLAMLLGTLEAGLRWTEIRVWNAAGERSLDVLLATDVLGVLVRTWLRSFVVILSHGWTVTRPSLGRCLTACVVVASFTYMTMSGAAVAVGYLAMTKFRAGLSFDASQLTHNALRSMVAVLDVAFAVWVVVATTCTLRYLNAVQQRAKLRRYKALRWMASLYILTSMGLILARQAILTRYSPYSPQYSAVTLLGQVVPLLFLASLAVLWRPHRSSWQYTYAPQVPHDDPSVMELTPLTAEGLEPPVRRRRRSIPTESTLGSSGDPVDSGSAYSTKPDDSNTPG